MYLILNTKTHSVIYTILCVHFIIITTIFIATVKNLFIVIAYTYISKHCYITIFKTGQ